MLESPLVSLVLASLYGVIKAIGDNREDLLLECSDIFSVAIKV